MTDLVAAVAFAAFGVPKRLKNFSIGEPLRERASRLREDVSPTGRILTRTEITAGLTFSTMSAKPIGRARVLGLLRKILRLRRARKEGGVRRQIGRHQECRRRQAGDRGGQKAQSPHRQNAR